MKSAFIVQGPVVAKWLKLAHSSKDQMINSLFQLFQLYLASADERCNPQYG